MTHVEDALKYRINVQPSSRRVVNAFDKETEGSTSRSERLRKRQKTIGDEQTTRTIKDGDAGPWLTPRSDDEHHRRNGDRPREQDEHETNLQRPQKNVKSHDEKQLQGQPSRAYYVVEEDETSSEEEEAQPQQAVKEKSKILPAWDKEIALAHKDVTTDEDVLTQVRKQVHKIVSDLSSAAGVEIADATRAKERRRGKLQRVNRRSREETHSLLCLVSYETVERSVGHWASTLLTGTRPDRTECDCCNYTNERLGARTKQAADDDARPNHFGRVIQIDLQNWKHSALGGERTALRAIETHWGVAFSSYHKTKGAHDLLTGIETVLDDFEHMGAEPEVIICDIESSFVTDDFKALLKTRGIELLPHTQASPEQTGLVERLNQTINAMRAACLFQSKLGDAFRFVCDRHCMKVRNDFIVTGGMPSTPTACATGKRKSPRLLHTWFSDVWCLDATRIRGQGLIKDDSARLRGYYVGYDSFGILVFDPYSGSIIRAGPRQYIIRERMDERPSCPLDITVYDNAPDDFAPPNYRAKAATVTAWGQGLIPWSFLSSEEKRRIKANERRRQEKPPEAKKPRALKKQGTAVESVSKMLAKRADTQEHDVLAKAHKTLKKMSLKRERYEDAGEDEGDETPTPTNQNVKRKNVPVDQTVMGLPVAFLFPDAPDQTSPGWHVGVVRRVYKNGEPEPLYSVRFTDGDNEDYTLAEIQHAHAKYTSGQRADFKRKKGKRRSKKSPETARPTPGGRRSPRNNVTIDIANAIHFDLDLFATSNDEEWEGMEETCVLRNALCHVTDKKNKPTFKHRRHRPEHLRKASRRLRKLNAVVANPDAPSARECLDPNTSDYDLWEASTMKEVAGVVRQALEAIPVDDLTRQERRDIMRSKLVCRVKRNEYGAIEKRKVRLVACGNTSIKGVHHNTTHAPTASPVSIRTLVAIATKLRKVIRSFDLEQCYLQAPIQQPCLLKDGARLLMYPPRELILKDKWGRPCVFQVTSNLYGLASGGADSFTHVDAHMVNEQHN